jgi:hypothetical protein
MTITLFKTYFKNAEYVIPQKLFYKEGRWGREVGQRREG